MRIIKLIFKWLFISLISVFILLSIIPYLFEEKQQNALVKPFSNSYFFNYNNTTFHYRLFTPKHIEHQVFLIHGFGASSFCFRKNIDSLVKANSLVVTIDMTGFGYSDKSTYANYTDSNKINAIHCLTTQINKQTNIHHWTFIGHSMGGIAIGQIASKYPALVKSLVFIDGLPFHQNHLFIQNLILYPPLLKWADIILEHQLLNYNTFQKLISLAYNEPADFESTIGYLEPFKLAHSGSTIFKMAALMGYTDVNDSVLTKLPKLIIWGKQDQWIPLSMAKPYLTKANTTSLIIKNAGHCPMETHPNEVNSTITNFIRNSK